MRTFTTHSFELAVLFSRTQGIVSRQLPWAYLRKLIVKREVIIWPTEILSGLGQMLKVTDKRVGDDGHLAKLKRRDIFSLCSGRDTVMCSDMSIIIDMYSFKFLLHCNNALSRLGGGVKSRRFEGLGKSLNVSAGFFGARRRETAETRQR